MGLQRLNNKPKQFERDGLTEKIIGACYEVRRSLGPGFPERIYQTSLKAALKKAGIRHATEEPFKVNFDGEAVGTFRVDLLVEARVIVEIKAVSGIVPRLFEDQILSYLKAARLKTGLLVNFGNRSCQIRRLML